MWVLWVWNFICWKHDLWFFFIFIYSRKCVVKHISIFAVMSCYPCFFYATGLPNTHLWGITWVLCLYCACIRIRHLPVSRPLSVSVQPNKISVSISVLGIDGDWTSRSKVQQDFKSRFSPCWRISENADKNPQIRGKSGALLWTTIAIHSQRPEFFKSLSVCQWWLLVI